MVVFLEALTTGNFDKRKAETQRPQTRGVRTVYLELVKKKKRLSGCYTMYTPWTQRFLSQQIHPFAGDALCLVFRQKDQGRRHLSARFFQR